MAPPPRLVDLEVMPSKIAGRGVFAAKPFAPDELIEVCPLLLLERSVWGLSKTLDDHAVSVPSARTPIALPLGYGALYNHGDSPNAAWTVDEAKSVMEVRAVTQIEPGEEILIHYGEHFFEARGIAVRR